MLGVWSFWSRPHYAGHGFQWPDLCSFLLAWGLSVQLGRRHFQRLMLVTDDRGARLLAERLQLPFDTVAVLLNELDDVDPHWWALGKLYAYRAQTEPFVHVDGDVFLWQPLPATLLSAPVLAQHPEHFCLIDQWSYYHVRELEDLFLSTGGSLPAEWRWYSASSELQTACNCGIVGGQHVDFLRHYAELGIQMARRPENVPAWKRWPHGPLVNILVEQYLLHASVQYHRQHRASPFAGVEVRYLFPTWAAALDPATTSRAGYTHVIGAAKSNPHLMRDLAARVRQDYPELYDRCQRMAASAGGADSAAPAPAR